MPFILNLEKTPSQLFSKNLVRIKYIQHIQNDLTKSDAGELDLKIWFLNQSYIFQLIAFWQVFIEELTEYGFKSLEGLENGGIFRDIARLKLDESLKRFNTPSKDNIDKLFEETLGIKKISNYWCSDAITRDVAVRTLGELLQSRHEIAHTGRTSSHLSYETNFEKMKILMEIAELTEKAVVEQLTSRSSGQPKASLLPAAELGR